VNNLELFNVLYCRAATNLEFSIKLLINWLHSKCQKLLNMPNLKCMLSNTKGKNIPFFKLLRKKRKAVNGCYFELNSDKNDLLTAIVPDKSFAICLSSNHVSHVSVLFSCFSKVSRRGGGNNNKRLSSRLLLLRDMRPGGCIIQKGCTTTF